MMTPFNLKRIWRFSSLLVICVAVYRLSGCQPGIQRIAEAVPKDIEPSPAPAETDSTLALEQTYSYVGKVARRPRTESAVGDVPAAKDRTMLTRETKVDTVRGAVPDFYIGLSDADILQVMSHYGYVPAITAGDKLLGKIEGEGFLPLREDELTEFSSRGRSGETYPYALRWKERISQELQMSMEMLQVIFLVPRSTEAFFIRTEEQALLAARKSAAEVSLIRAHFGPNLEIVVDELVTHSGDIVPVDSVRTTL